LPVAEIIVGLIEATASILALLERRKLLTGGTVRKLEKQLFDIRKKLDSAKDELYAVAKNVVDYKEVYRRTVDSLNSCVQLRALLDLHEGGYNRESQKIAHMVFTETYKNLSESVNELDGVVNALNLGTRDPLVKSVRYVKDDMDDLEVRLQKKMYKSVVKDLTRVQAKLADIEKTIGGRMYDSVVGIVETLKTSG